MSSPFYDPLPPNTIRLLQFEPGEHDTDLQCRLSSVSLEEGTGIYIALSYVWGPTDRPKRIIWNGHAAEITANLHTALLEYRRRGTIGGDLLPLWVDALCINQNDDGERTTQVRMMKRIYEQASAVVVWLGPAPGPGDDNLDLVTLDAIHLPWKQQGGLQLFSDEDVMAIDAWFGEKLPDLALDSLARFLQTPWFHRIWVIQELLSAQQSVMWRGELVIDPEMVIVGALRISSLHNVNVRLQIGTPDQLTRQHITCAGRLALLRQWIAVDVNKMFYLLSATRNFEATDPRDKFFALVGIASDMEEEFIDYSKDVGQIVTELSRRFLTGKLACLTNPLDILSFISRLNGEGEHLPSWVTDWMLLGISSLYTPLAGAYPSEAPYIQGNPILEFEDDKVSIMFIMLHTTYALHRHSASRAPSSRRSSTSLTHLPSWPAKSPWAKCSYPKPPVATSPGKKALSTSSPTLAPTPPANPPTKPTGAPSSATAKQSTTPPFPKTTTATKPGPILSTANASCTTATTESDETID